MMHMIDVIYCVLCIESCSCRVFASSDRGTVVCCCAVPMDVCARDAECHDVKVKSLAYTEYKYCICIYNNNYIYIFIGSYILLIYMIYFILNWILYIIYVQLIVIQL